MFHSISDNFLLNFFNIFLQYSKHLCKNYFNTQAVLAIVQAKEKADSTYKYKLKIGN